ncbi:hypothetical protein PPERSA_07075 [Pseudocohnilembus persalinus]|uniref:Uncharacterized protein n=1 Tax=Pseudocohnilembus persalinus TaxID=266149 RepID=A0A0V0QXX9_PSEPJ|nr:hypothetical protein PPERSA_07075 [Pseudocohnilembus persalinus]|eukprot:KRX06912.1 hypothetical protein PPERSA_07075 [Pseudocohnilembus persalinus]
MQHLFRNSPFNSPHFYRRTDQAHSPLHKAIFNMEEKRSQLFLDRRRIPGRKAKLLVALGILCQFWGMQQLTEVKNFQKNRDKEMQKLQRKSAPFLQAQNDLRFLALEDKKDLLIQELFDGKPQSYIDSITERYHQKDVWAPFRHRYQYMYNKTHRNVRPYSEAFMSRYIHGFDRYSI